MPGAARLQSVRTLGRAVAVGLLVLVSAPPGPAGAAESQGTATQDGWWNRLQGPVDAEPEDNPIRALVPAVPTPPTVPADAIVVGATAGQVDKVAAVGLDVSLAEGAALDGLVLRLKESTEPGANVGADGAKVIACPATAAWGPGQNAAWRDRPPADCGLGSAEGVRGDDGTWTFDLATLGRLWVDPFAPLAPNGVVLSVDPNASPSAQVSWLNFDSGNVVVELTATPGTPAAPVDAGPGAPDPVIAAAAPVTPVPDASTTDAGAFPTSGEAVFGDSAGGAIAPPTNAVAPVGGSGVPEDAGPAEAPAEATFSAAPDRPGPAVRARPAVDFWENVPGPTALLVPVTAGLAVLVGMALGPGGRPAPVLRREGGLSRALARRSAAGGDAGARPTAAAR